MAVVFQIDGQTLRCEAETIAIGRLPSNQISLPDDSRLAPVHAVLRLVNGRWIIESQGGGTIRVGDGRPTQFAWLNPGDVIHLTETGPDVIFAPETTGAASPAVPVVASSVPPQPGHAVPQLVAAEAGVPKWILFTGAGTLAAALLIGIGLYLAGQSRPVPKTAGADPAAIEHSRETAPALAPSVPAADPRRALYRLELRTADRSRTVQLGTAWAATPRQLMTTGDVARGIALNQEFYPAALARHTLTGEEFEITGLSVHPQFAAAAGRLEQAVREIQRLQPELERTKEADQRKTIEELLHKFDSEAIVAADETVNVNIALLDLAKDAPAALSCVTGPLVKIGQQVTLLGHALSQTDVLVDPDHPIPLQQCVGRLQHIDPVRNPLVPTRYLIRFDDLKTGQNWSGSPVLNSTGTVIGLYARPTPPPPGMAAVPIVTHDVTPLEGVRDWLTKSLNSRAAEKTN